MYMEAHNYTCILLWFNDSVEKDAVAEIVLGLSLVNILYLPVCSCKYLQFINKTTKPVYLLARGAACKRAEVYCEAAARILFVNPDPQIKTFFPEKTLVVYTGNPQENLEYKSFILERFKNITSVFGDYEYPYTRIIAAEALEYFDLMKFTSGRTF